MPPEHSSPTIYNGPGAQLNLFAEFIRRLLDTIHVPFETKPMQLRLTAALFQMRKQEKYDIGPY